MKTVGECAGPAPARDRSIRDAAGFRTALLSGASLVAALGLAALPQAAAAQTGVTGSTGAAAPDDTSALQEVVVTAQRVETNVQRTPIAMDVINSDLIKSQGITGVASLATVSPSLNISGTAGGTVLTIRGISSRDTTEIGDPAVVVSVDGFYQDRAYALGLTQFDLDRIEVLRGPQGTLYGRNATGGAINIITARPSKTAGGYAQVTAGSYNTLNTEGALNIPLTDRIQMRGSFATNYHTGYYAGGPFGKSDDADDRSGRLQIQVEPIDNLRIRATVQHTVQTSGGSAGQQTPYQIDAQGFVRHDFIPPLDPKDYPKAYFSRTNLNDTVYRWDAEYTTPYAVLTYLGGYDRLKWDNLAPGFFYNRPATAADPNPAPFQSRVYNQRERPITTNQEFRIASPDPDSRFTYQLGIFYFQNHNQLDSFNQIPNGTPNPTPVIHFVYDVRIKSLAEMGQVGFKILDNLKLTAGIRHNWDYKRRTGFIFFSQALPANAVPVTTRGTVKKNTYHIGLDYQVTPQSLLYAKYDTGYKSGGFTDIAPYGPEDVKTWEVGTKNRFLDNRLQLNFDVYHSKYTGQQVQQIVQGGGGLRIVNAGKTSYWGAEGDLTAALPFGRAELNVAYLDADFTDFLLATGVPRFVNGAWSSTNVNVQLEGNHPQQAPKWTVGAAFEHSEEVFNGRLTGRISTKYQSKQYFTFFNRPDDTQKGYAITNLLLTYAPNDSGWQLQGFINNLSDKRAFATAGPNDRNFVYSYQFLPPRTYGGRISYRW